MKKLLFISFFIIGCNSNSNQKIPVVENEPVIDNSNLNNELYKIDKEIINNPKSPNVYLKRAKAINDIFYLKDCTCCDHNSLC